MEIILGALVSVIVQLIKNKVGGEYARLALVVVMSLIGAAFYTLLVTTGYWQTFGQILVVAGAFYTFVIARFTN